MKIKFDSVEMSIKQEIIITITKKNHIGTTIIIIIIIAIMNTELNYNPTYYVTLWKSYITMNEAYGQ